MEGPDRLSWRQPPAPTALESTGVSGLAMCPMGSGWYLMPMPTATSRAQW
jgi:hypothetical protein